MHAKGKVHRDIKPGNIVVVGGPGEETLQAKVADFGLTCGEQQECRCRTILIVSLLYLLDARLGCATLIILQHKQCSRFQSR